MDYPSFCPSYLGSLNQFNNKSYSPAYWMRQLDNFLFHQNKQSQPCTIFLNKFLFQVLEASAPTLVQCIQNLMTESQREVSEVFALLDLQESLMENIPRPFIDVFDNDLEEVALTVYKNLPAPARNRFIANDFQVWYKYFSRPKLSTIYARCMEVKTEALEYQLTDTTKKLKTARSSLECLKSESESKYKELQNELQNIDKTNKEKEEEYDQYNTTLETQIKEKSELLQELQNELLQKENNIIEKDREIAKLKQFEVATINFKESVDEISTLSSQIQEQTATINDEIFGLRDKVKEIADLLIRIISEKETKIRQWKDKAQGLVFQNDLLRLQISEKDKEISKLKNKIVEFSAQSLQINDKVEFKPKAEAKIQESDQEKSTNLEIREHEHEIGICRKKLTSQFQELKADRASLKLQIKDRGSQDKKISQLEKELALQKEEIRRLELEIKNLKNEIAEDKNDFSDLKAKLSLKTTMLTSKDLEIDLLKNEIDGKTAQNKSQKEFGFRLCEEFDELQSKIEKLEKELKVQFAEVKRLQSHIENQVKCHNCKMENIRLLLNKGSITDIRNEVVEILDRDTEEIKYASPISHGSSSSSPSSKRRRKDPQKTGST